MDITRLIPMPTPVTLGGRTLLASEFRLRDVAQLQGWINRRLPSPYDQAADVLESGDRSPAWKRLLSDVIDRQQEWPREPGDPEADALLRSGAGCKLTIALALRREQPGLTGAEIDALFAAATAREYSRLLRVAWGSDPMRAMAAMIDGPDDGEGDGPDWGELWYRWTTTATAGGDFADLTVSQFIAFRCEGSPAAGVVTGPDAYRMAERRRKFFEETAGDN